MATIVQLHSPAGLAATPRCSSRAGEYGLADIARALGLLHFTVRTIVDKLRVLAERAGMPLPRTPRIVDGAIKTGPAAIYAKSRWSAPEFDAWIENRDPPGAPIAQPRPLAKPLRDEMARRANALGAAA